MKKEDNYLKCPKCGGLNSIDIVSCVDGMILQEMNTECNKCKHLDFWSYGRYQIYPAAKAVDDAFNKHLELSDEKRNVLL